MKIDIKFRHNYGYLWYEKQGIYVKGYVIHESTLYQKEDLVKLLLEHLEKGVKLENILTTFYGIFSIAIKTDDKIHLISDTTRTFPMFYAVANDEILISDDTFFIKKKIDGQYNKDLKTEFLRCGYVTGPETLINGVYQVQAGEIVVISEDGQIMRKFYHDYTVTQDELLKDSSDALKKEFLKILDKAIKRLILMANGDTIVIPLSGGYDSRAIATMLKKNGYENVILYTYGKPDSTEVRVAREVAKNLEFEWIFVEQNEDIVDPDYPERDFFLEFYKYAFNHVSTIHLQDFFVFKHLHDNSVIPKNSIIVPGHSGDFLGGSHLRKLPIPKSKRDVFNTILIKHYIVNEHIKLSPYVVKKINEYLNSFSEHTLPYSLDDNWNMKERQAKFIVNSNRTYEFFGYRHAIPLWDLELVEFFRRVPLEYKTKEVIYSDALRESVFKDFGVVLSQKDVANTMALEFYHRIFHSMEIFRHIRYFAEKNLPSQIKRPLKDLIQKDENNLYVVAKPLLRKMNRKWYLSEFNGIVAEWCLANLEGV
ncbi:asparagine synthase [Pyrococcus furiosus DSM 3638]|uniref:Asparagine synthetase domain-containing protein n=4 Tax=Pyrococcus furiosus TaxID=2261 RepID=Q8U2P1_PYRFU|nr:asparagine synthase C-terminal domain-containing protein [Pyrococcus furiosus]AAL80916.1 hypothetical protein PF0792 [Pyrococcus furiosus DSM 3638]AFN03579.1 hypothetical protein PFC_03130 [Pyrococcus furiosus COM1]QEK78471.1 asparagine synthase [Pyrococcus furiosus DSM 3638]